MLKSVNCRLARLYLWIGLGYFIMGVINTFHKYSDRFAASLFNNLWGIIYIIPLNFIFFEYAVPFVLKRRSIVIINILWGILLLFVFMMLWSYGSYAWRLLGIQLHSYTALKDFDQQKKVVENQMAYSAGAIFFFGIIRHIYNYVRLKQAQQQLKIEKQTAELNYLRSQTNPHFLFNTLNNIYSLSRDKSDLAPESILRLSKILRFMLYETGGSYISIEQELKIITDYIDLEKLRYDESLRINFNYNVEDMKQALPPLLLIPLVENAFKHGASETRGAPFVDIHLTVANRQLKFIVKNSVDVSAFSEASAVKENIGLSNLRRQLVLLYKDYELSVQQSGAVFTAVLKINLASHV
jgi:two-component system LytT family sensor kinase